MPRTTAAPVALALLSILAPAAFAGAERPIRFFFPSAGLSDPGNLNSPAQTPVADFGISPDFYTTLNQPARLYIWAKLDPAGTPNNVTFNGVSLNVRLQGSGIITGSNFW